MMVLSKNLEGAAWILASCIAGTVFSVGIKALAGAIHSIEITAIRCIIGMMILAPLIWRAGGLRKTLKSDHWKIQIFRGFIAVIAINCGFYTLTVLPLTTATTLFFTAPLFVTILAPIMLKETVGWRRYTATAAGFAGVLIVLRPFDSAFDPNMLVALFSSIFFAFSLILSKRLSVTESPTTMMAYFAIVTIIFAVPPALPLWLWPTPLEWVILVVVSIFATCRTYFDIKGFSAGDASFVAPFQYFRIIFISASAYLIFSEVPDTYTIAGASVIIAATLYIAQREARLKTTKPGAAAA